MKKQQRNTLLAASLTALCLAGIAVVPAPAEGPPAPAPLLEKAPPAVVRLTLDEAKQRALANNKLLNLASMNAESKAYAIKAIQADYFPKVIGNDFYFHFNDDLGTVVSTPSRMFKGPLGREFFLGGKAIAVSVINEDTNIASLSVVQPITDLLKVRQGVKIAQADQAIAQAQWEKGVRELASGVEQLYWGLLAARHIQAGAVEAVRGAEELAKTHKVQAKVALVEAQQGLQQVNVQIADLQEQLNALLDLPPCTVLELVEPPVPVVPYHCCDEVIGLALAASPEIREAQSTIAKAQAALCAGKLDYVPSIALMGGYLNQTAADYIQPNISYVGVVGSYTFFDGGKRRAVIHEREDLVGMASLKLRQTEDEVRQKATKAFREVGETQEALKQAQELVTLLKEAEKTATTPEALTNPLALALLLKASKDLMLAEVEVVKADLAYRQAYVKVMSLVGKH
jgi:outer membrane protein TolC